MFEQVKVLELEQALQQERQKLGALRKKHYELAGVKEENDEEQEAAPAVSEKDQTNRE